MTMIDTNNERVSKPMEKLCRRCRFHPASPRIAGYCSWDCYEEDDDDQDPGTDGEDKRAA